ncbi:MAG: NDP-sugar synthase [bacterium]
MKAMILAAGLGTRLRPLTHRCPKVMIPVANRPLIEHTLCFLRRFGIREAIINLHYLPEIIKKRLGDGYRLGMKIAYSYEPTIMGTAGGLKQTEYFLKGETFILINGDTLIDFDLKAALAYHKAKQALATMILTDYRPEFGAVEVDQEGRIRDIVGILNQRDEVGAPSAIPMTFVGLHILEPKIFDYIPQGRPAEINREIYPAMIKEGKRIYGYQMQGYFRDLGEVSSYLEAHQDIMDGKLKLEIDLREKGDGIWMKPGGAIAGRFEITPPVMIGNNCRLKGRAEIGEYTVIGDNCILEAGISISRSVVWEGSRVKGRIEKSVVTPQ